MTSISWLHLTDLHIGMTEEYRLWPRMREKFLDDLSRLHKKCGPWDLVLFTGDLTYKGSPEEFQKVNDILDQLWNRFKELAPDSKLPELLVVPGNHDLVRPEKNEKYRNDVNYKKAVETLTQRFNTISKEFWQEPTLTERQVVEDAFVHYKDWWKNQFYKPKGVQDGLLPGDFSYTFQKGDAKIGILGLNTSFRQLTNEVSKDQLSLDLSQFHKSCQPSYTDGINWSKQHHTCLLMTHHPSTWLDRESQRQLKGEIIPDYFSLHLCGHLHEADSRQEAEAGNPLRQIWLSCSLFGLEYYGKDNKCERSHGYTAGRIDLIPGEEKKGRLIFFPRAARKQGEAINIVPDYSIRLEEYYSHTEPRDFQLIRDYTSDTLPDPLPNSQDDVRVSTINECSSSVNEILGKYKQMQDWKRLHEILQSACSESVKNRLQIDRNISEKKYKFIISLRENWWLTFQDYLNDQLKIDKIETKEVKNRFESTDGNLYADLHSIEESLSLTEGSFLKLNTDTSSVNQFKVIIKNLNELEDKANHLPSLHCRSRTKQYDERNQKRY